MKKIKVFVIDDHAVVRLGLKLAFKLSPEMEFVGELAGGENAGAAVVRSGADVTLLDIRMPKVDDIAALKDIRAADPAAKVVMLTTSGTDESIFQALEAGAAGYVMKDVGSDAIVEAVRAVAAGGRYVPESVQMVYDRRKAAPVLTPRESEALKMMARGASNKEVAKALGVSEACVKVHLRHVFEKLGVHDRIGAVRAAIQRGLVDPEG